MKLLDRSALIVRPREPYLRWAASLDAVAANAASELASNTSVYLVDEDREGAAETPPIEDHFAEIFVSELAAWSTDESQWPKKRDLAMFLKWFDVTGLSMVFDLGRDEIEGEEFLLR